jgi:solute carrier family 25 phosphate transporter 23/24/25/41
MREIYEHELLSRMGRPKGDPKPVDWADFMKYANEKESELWRIFHHELDLVSPPLFYVYAPCTRVS